MLGYESLAQISSYQCCTACQVITICTSEGCSWQTVPNPRSFVIKRKTLKLTVGSALHALLILSNYTTQTITINKSILRELSESFKYTGSRKTEGDKISFAGLQPLTSAKKKLPHSIQQHKRYRYTWNFWLSSCLQVGSTITTSTWACNHRKAQSFSALATHRHIRTFFQKEWVDKAHKLREEHLKKKTHAVITTESYHVMTCNRTTLFFTAFWTHYYI